MSQTQQHLTKASSESSDFSTLGSTTGSPPLKPTQPEPSIEVVHLTLGPENTDGGPGTSKTARSPLTADTSSGKQSSNKASLQGKQDIEASDLTQQEPTKMKQNPLMEMSHVNTELESLSGSPPRISTSASKVKAQSSTANHPETPPSSRTLLISQSNNVRLLGDSSQFRHHSASPDDTLSTMTSSSRKKLLTGHQNPDTHSTSSIFHDSVSIPTLSPSFSPRIEMGRPASAGPTFDDINNIGGKLPSSLDQLPRSILTSKMSTKNEKEKKSFAQKFKSLFDRSKSKQKSKNIGGGVHSSRESVSSTMPLHQKEHDAPDKHQSISQTSSGEIPISVPFSNQNLLYKHQKHYGQSHKYNPNLQTEDTSSEISSSHRSNTSTPKCKDENMTALRSSKPENVVYSHLNKKKIKKGELKIKLSPGKAKTFIFGIGFEVDETHKIRSVKKQDLEEEAKCTSSDCNHPNHDHPYAEDPHFNLKDDYAEEDAPHVGTNIREKFTPLHRQSLPRRNSRKSLSKMFRPLSMRALNRLSRSGGADDSISANSKFDEVIQFDCARQLPREIQRHLSIYKDQEFHYSLRSSLLLYDRYGFMLKGSYVKKKVKNHLTYHFERRRAIQDALTVRLNRDFSAYVSRSVSRSNRKYAEKVSALGSMFHSMKDSFLHKSNIEDQLFIENDTCYDVEQLKLQLHDPDQVKHMILVLHLDAPAIAFTYQKIISKNMKGLNLLSHAIPKIRPYIRVIDANEQKEVLRYYIDSTPKLSVALEMDQVMRQQYKSVDRILYEIVDDHRENVFHNQYCSRNRARRTQESGTKCKKITSPQSLDNTESTKNNYSSPAQEVETDSLSNPSDDSSSEASDISYQEIRVEQSTQRQDIHEADQMMEWEVVPLKDEYEFQTPFGTDPEKTLSQFLFLSNENDFGTRSIPPLPQKYFVTVEQARNISQRRSSFFTARSKYFCIVSTDSAHQTEKKRTNHLPKTTTMMWSEEFTFLVQPSCRSSAVVVELYEKNRFGIESLVGVATFPFGEIHHKNTDNSASKAQWCPLYLRGHQTGEILIRLELYWKPKLTINAHGNSVLVED